MIKSQTVYKRKPPFFLLGLVSILTVIVLSTLLIWFVLVREYKQWEGDFLKDKTDSSFVTLNDENLLKSLNKKLDAFSKSTKKTDFVEITDKEFVYVVGESLNSSLPLGIKFEKGFAVTNKGNWDLYIQTKYKKTNLPWLVFRLQKDNTQTSQLYVQRMSIGNFDFTDYGAKVILDRVNTGIKEAILLVNESEFTGRIFRNIELEIGKMIIKGDR